MRKRVMIVSPDPAYIDMYKQAGWEIVDNLDKASLVQFTGGEDVHPAYYGEDRHPHTYANIGRDDDEAVLFHKARDNNIPMVGICRGGQFLNVMCGGRMWQHVDNHAIAGTHQVHDLWTKEDYQATSTHHQMMRPSVKAIVIAVASLANFKESMDGSNIEHHEFPNAEARHNNDVEVCYYQEQNALCFQPHPEFGNALACRSHFFRYVNDYLFDGEIN